ncbi:MAG: site-specific integrase [Alphaproteobacteria bacterium]|nr:site-specific integrase [Alphaproteobacteria bacterium]
MRVRIPACLNLIARTEELTFSLGTSIYQEAIEKYRVEFAHLQAFLTILKDIIMRVNENKQLELNEADVDKLLLHRLEQIQAFLENNTEDIKAKRKTEADIILFPNGKKEADIRKLMTTMLIDYLKGLMDKNKANITLRTVYHQLKNKEIELGLVKEGDKYDWLKAFSTHISQLDHYAKKAVETERDEKTYTPKSAKVVTLLRTYDAMKTDERIHTSMAATHWKKFFKRYVILKKNIKGTSDKRLHKLQKCIWLAFALMKREYVEDVTKQDCRHLCELIHRVPKRWQEKIKGDGIFQILTNNPDKSLSKTTIQGYLIVFKEFMRYAEKEEIISNNLNTAVDVPVRTNPLAREPFTTDDLHKMFNPKTYIDPHLLKNQGKFWVPIIALYHGCRLNEICQLDVTDIVREKGIPCISINENAPDKSVKNKGSQRVIPIHPKLLEMGFLYFVEYQRRAQNRKLFNLTQIRNGMYGCPVQHWFARYLDKIGITEPSKVFHSFRHTFETMATEKRIPPQYQNAICGWTDQGIGQRVYAHKKDIKIMREELSKISYPINRELAELKKLFMDSFVIRQLRTKN